MAAKNLRWTMLSVNQKVLGQVDGEAGAFVELYVVPAGKSAVCWKVIATNRTAGASAIRVVRERSGIRVMCNAERNRSNTTRRNTLLPVMEGR